MFCSINGITVLLERALLSYISQIEQSDFIIVVGTPNYREKYLTIKTQDMVMWLQRRETSLIHDLWGQKHKR